MTNLNYKTDTRLIAFDSGTGIITLNSQTFGLAARNTRAASRGGYQQFLG